MTLATTAMSSKSDASVLNTQCFECQRCWSVFTMRLMSCINALGGAPAIWASRPQRMSSVTLFKQQVTLALAILLTIGLPTPRVSNTGNTRCTLKKQVGVGWWTLPVPYQLNTGKVLLLPNTGPCYILWESWQLKAHNEAVLVIWHILYPAYRQNQHFLCFFHPWLPNKIFLFHLLIVIAK